MSCWKWLVFALVLTGCGSKGKDVGPLEGDYSFIDTYLSSWHAFANGKNELVPYLKDNKAAFETALSERLNESDRGAPARMVFYGVVQVVGMFPTESELSKAIKGLVKDEVKPVKTGEGYFSGDLYYWWKKNEGKYEPYEMLTDWEKSAFAKETVIPMYEASAKK
ncbi:MAG: hypothetical protein WAO58_08785 [Fimbriimonadaceae bacterium]